ncbi:hypothetical protein TNCV_2897631 [Trichonephila clavipes]|nr:hypothetical protein TNCV_2897631 [Trichonephila clavipes]
MNIFHEAHLLGLYSYAASHNPLIIKSNHDIPLNWCRALSETGPYMSGNRFSGEMNQDSFSTSWLTESKFGVWLNNDFGQNALCLQ